MDTVKLIVLLCCTYHSIASDSHSHNIPIGEYDSKLQDLGTHVEYPETPVKVIKITKTIAVKVPVPYPVKVIEKVPYPVHVAKPYPVPVPQIVKVPQPYAHPSREDYTANGQQGHSYGRLTAEYGKSSDGQYSPPSDGDSYSGINHSGNLYGDEHYDGAAGHVYSQPANSYTGYSGSDGETKSYDDAIQEYLQKHAPAGGNLGAPSDGHYH